MNRKMIALVMVVVIGVLAVSAFSWTTDHDLNHQGMAIYNQSERANYAEFYLLATNQQGMAIYHQSERSSYAGISALGFNQLRDVESARWMGAALTSQVQAPAAVDLSWPPRPDFSHLNQQVIIPVTGSVDGLAVYHQSEWNSAQVQATEQQNRDVESARWMGAALASQAQEMSFHFTSPGR